MSFIGNPLVSQAFVTDSFSGNGSTTAFTMSVAPATTAAVLVAISGVVQDPSTYSIVGTTLTFSQAPPSATANISTRYLGIPSTGVTSTAYRTVTEFTATAAQTTFTPPSFTPGFVNVYRNGVLLGSADYVASSGTAVVLSAAATLGDLVTIESFLVSSILNAVVQTNGSSVNQVLTTPTISNPTITTPTITSPIFSGNVGIGTTSPSAKLEVVGVFRSGTSAVNIDLYSDAGGVYFESTGTSSANRAIRLQSQDGSNNYAQLFVNGGSNYVSLATNTTERMRIDSNGNLLLGLTSSYLGALSGSIQFSCTGNNNSALFRSNSSSGGVYGPWIQFSAQSPNNTSNYFLYCSDSSAVRTVLDSNGGLRNYSGNNVNLSDRREKTNFAPSKSYLDIICAIPVQTFNYIDQNLEDDDGLTLGVVAQDVQAVAPELIHESNWASKNEPEKMRLSIYQTDLQYALMKCIQELSAEVTALKAKVGA